MTQEMVAVTSSIPQFIEPMLCVAAAKPPEGPAWQTSEDMKRCRWLRLQMVAVIEFLEWTPDNHSVSRSSLGSATIGVR